MNRFTHSPLASLVTTVLVASALLLGGCSNSVTGPKQAEEDVTVQQQAEHNSMNDGNTDPAAGHNTTDED